MLGKGKYSIKKVLDMDTLLRECNMLSINERVDWTRLKNVIKFKLSTVPKLNSFYLFSSNTRCSRTLPLITIESCNSETLRKSVKFKSSHVWNTLPKDWDIQEFLVSGDIGEFKTMVFDYLVEKRKDIWLTM
jgi:lipopolysaccharide export LptBFGC system permease protein LptF